MIASVGYFPSCSFGDTVSPFLLLKESIMNATQTKLVNDFNTFIEAGKSFGQAMQSYAKRHDMTIELQQALADVVARHYQCHTKVTNQGGMGFYADAECKQRHETARKCWQRNVAVWFESKPKPKPTTRKQVDKVQATATRLQKQLKKNEIARLIKLLSA